MNKGAVVENKRWTKIRNLQKHEALTAEVKARLKAEKARLEEKVKLIEGLLGKPTAKPTRVGREEETKVKRRKKVVKRPVAKEIGS